MDNDQLMEILGEDSDLGFMASQKPPSTTVIQQWKDMINWIEQTDSQKGILTEKKRQRLKVIKMIVDGWSKKNVIEIEGREGQDEEQI